MHEFRITKYDPALRDSSGIYMRLDEWTSICDIGKSITREDYLRVERDYLDVALAFLDEARLDHMTITWPPGEIHAPAQYCSGDSLPLAEVRTALQSMLREEMWAVLHHRCGAFIHVGYDYYMYLGVPSECPQSVSLASARGLFVESFISPYHPRPDVEDDEFA